MFDDVVAARGAGWALWVVVDVVEVGGCRWVSYGCRMGVVEDA